MLFIGIMKNNPTKVYLMRCELFIIQVNPSFQPLGRSRNRRLGSRESHRLWPSGARS